MSNAVLHKTFPLLGIEPLEVYLRLRSKDDHCFILESLEGNARWTFIGWDPLFELSINNGRITQTRTSTGDVTFDEEVADVNAYLKGLLQTYYRTSSTELPPFSGGLMGYFAYDFVKYQEPTLKEALERAKDDNAKEGVVKEDVAKDDVQFNDCDLMFFDKVVAIDHVKNELHIILNVTDTYDLPPSITDLDAIYEYISTADFNARPQLKLASTAKYRFSENEFAQMIQTAKHHINEGDIFQVVLSNLVEFEASGSLFEVYKTLRETNPSPYMFYMSSSQLEIAGASPETLVSTLLQPDGTFEAATYPLAGSRPRGENAAEDEALVQELLADEKELAEHNMLVDLGRNDIGKIAEIGSVKLAKYMDVLKFSHVMHIGSKVVGKVRDGLSAVDVIASVLPAGTLSGAPKVRAVKIINALEGDNRGIYGGCLGYLSLDGQMDMCITIRTAYMKSGKVFARAGAGIVMDSIPSLEYAETKNKLKAVLNAIETAAGGDVK